MPESAARMATLKLMLEQDIDVNARDDGSNEKISAEPGAADRFFTDLHRASGAPDHDLAAAGVAKLIAGGANSNARDADGRSPLHIACYYAHCETVRALLRAGSDPNARDNHCRTPLFYVVAGKDWARPTLLT